MPKIPTYDTPALDLRPSETGIDALQQAARRTGAFYHEAAQDVTGTGQRVASALETAGNVALSAEEHAETTAGMKNFATMVANKTEQWNKLASSPDALNDPGLKQKFLDGLENDLDNFTNKGFLTENGRQFAQAHAAQFRQHMFEKTTADVSRLAGEKAVVDTKQSINQWSNTVYNDSSSLDFALSSFRSSLDATINSSPNLGANAGHVRTTILEDGTEKIVKAAAIGAITRTGQVPSWVTDPKYSKYVNGAELEQFRKAAEAQTKANLYYERQIETLNKQRADLAVHTGAGEIMANSVTVDPNTGKVLIAPDFMQRSLDLARKNPDAPSAAATVRTMIDWAESQQRARSEPLVTDQATKAGLLTRMFDPNKPTSEIDVLRAAADGKLSSHDTSIMRELVKATGPDALREPLVHASLTAAGERVGQHLMIDGQERYANFLQDFWPKYLAAKRANTLPDNALDLSDPNSMIRKSLKQFEPDPAQRMQAHTEKLIGVSLGQLPKAGTAPAVTKNLTGPNTETLPRILDKAAYDKLEPGARFTDQNGNIWTKPERK